MGVFLWARHPLQTRESRAGALRDVYGILPVEGYLAHKKHPTPRTLQQDYIGSWGGPRGVGVVLRARHPLQARKGRAGALRDVYGILPEEGPRGQRGARVAPLSSERSQHSLGR